MFQDTVQQPVSTVRHPLELIMSDEIVPKVRGLTAHKEILMFQNFLFGQYSILSHTEKTRAFEFAVRKALPQKGEGSNSTQETHIFHLYRSPVTTIISSTTVLLACPHHL